MKHTKYYGIAAAIIAALISASCTYKVVPAGHAAVQATFGKVSNDGVLSEGLHFVNPFSAFTMYSLQDQAYELENVAVPSQDNFKSSVGITVMYRFDKSYLTKIRREAGQESDAVNKYMRQKLLSVVREFGKSVPNAQDLFKADIQNRLQVEIQREVSEYAGRYGIIVGDVFIQDITLDPTIQAQVIKVKQREQQIAQEKAQLAIVEQVAMRQVKQAESRAKAAQQDAKATEFKANAALYSSEKASDAKLYAAQAEAKANKALAQSVTPELLKLKEMEAKIITAKSWKGGVPQTIVGDSSSGVVPLFQMHKEIK
ncbi:SPFH domain-containing protein [Aeromonas veronii]|uniref:SPFH domain-containing protein n=1 Tax=Aeromonas veronii TaxID=654 RepID=UPI003B9E56BB